MVKELSVSIQKMGFTTGKQIQFCKDNKVLIVGSNNSGKSRFLRELNECLQGHAINKIILNTIDLIKNGNTALLTKVFDEHKNPNNGNITYRGHQAPFVNCSDWDTSNSLGSIYGFF